MELLPTPWLSVTGQDEERYVSVYSRILERVEGPVFLHWLGERFLSELEGYFPGNSFSRVMALAPEKVRGAKLSLLDPELEMRFRTELGARGQIVLTGDDFHFCNLVRGGDPWSSEAPAPAPEERTRIGGLDVPLGDFSHALLGILDAVAEPAGLALRFLARGDARTYTELMMPCEKLSRWVFRHPVRHYKAGLAVLAFLNGLQSNPRLVNREERARDVGGFYRTAALASEAGVLLDASLAAERLERLASGDC